MSDYRKVYVEVMAKFTPEGKVIPLSVLWEDGVIYKIDKVQEAQNRASFKVGGIGKRYECRIKGLKTYIFLENNRWFVEAKVYDHQQKTGEYY